MAKTPRQYVPLDMNYPRDAAIRRAGEAAELLYVRGLAFSKSGQTDGFIGEFDLEAVGVGLKNVRARVTPLVRENLWLPCEGGWQIRSWQAWNLTTGEVAESRQRGAAQTNHKRWHKTKPDPDCHLCTPEAA